MKILKDTEHKMLGFHEMEFEEEFVSTPSKQEILKLVAQKIKSDEALCTVVRIKGRFGTKTFRIIARAYKDAASKDNVEKVNKQVKKKEEAKK